VSSASLQNKLALIVSVAKDRTRSPARSVSVGELSFSAELKWQLWSTISTRVQMTTSNEGGDIHLERPEIRGTERPFFAGKSSGAPMGPTILLWRLPRFERRTPIPAPMIPHSDRRCF
jgi:hypothetical protein